MPRRLPCVHMLDIGCSGQPSQTSLSQLPPLWPTPSSSRKNLPPWGVVLNKSQPIQSVHPNHVLYRVLMLWPLCTHPKHLSARYQATRTSLFAPLNYSKLANLKPVHLPYPFLFAETIIKPLTRSSPLHLPYDWSLCFSLARCILSLVPEREINDLFNGTQLHIYWPCRV